MKGEGMTTNMDNYMNKLGVEVEKMIIDMLENSPHELVYEPKYPGELYVVSTNYRKLARKTAKKIIKLFEATSKPILK